MWNVFGSRSVSAASLHHSQAVAFEGYEPKLQEGLRCAMALASNEEMETPPSEDEETQATLVASPRLK